MDIKTKTERQTKEMVKETVFKERAQKVLTSMKENGMDQLIVSDPASINYLMGRLMNPGERLMVLVFDAAAGKTELVISKLYPQGDNPIWPVTYVDDVDDCVAILSEKIAETGVIGIDKNLPISCLIFITILVQKDFPSIRFVATVQMLLTRITVTTIPQETLATA